MSSKDLRVPSPNFLNRFSGETMPLFRLEDDKLIIAQETDDEVESDGEVN